MKIKDYNTDREKPAMRKRLQTAVFVILIIVIVLTVFRYFRFVLFWLDMGVKGAALATVLSQACSM